MGEAYSDHPTEPQSAAIFVAGFCFFAGSVNTELIRSKPLDYKDEYIIMIPPTPEWKRSIKEVYRDRATRRMRYATKKDAATFDSERLAQIVANLPRNMDCVRLTADSMKPSLLCLGLGISVGTSRAMKILLKTL